MVNRQIVLEQLPQGPLNTGHFRLVEAERPAPQDGEVLLRTRYISLDAANRAWMQGATYRAALNAGQVMAGGALAEVVAAVDRDVHAGQHRRGVARADAAPRAAAVPGRRLLG